MLAALCFAVGLVLAVAVLAWDADIELAWFAVCLFAGLLLGALGVGPAVTWRPGRSSE